jgi:hypothetical protein
MAELNVDAPRGGAHGDLERASAGIGVASLCDVVWCIFALPRPCAETPLTGYRYSVSVCGDPNFDTTIIAASELLRRAFGAQSLATAAPSAGGRRSLVLDTGAYYVTTASPYYYHSALLTGMVAYDGRTTESCDPRLGL